MRALIRHDRLDVLLENLDLLRLLLFLGGGGCPLRLEVPLEVVAARDRLVEELGPEAGAEAAKSLEDALSEFQLKVEEMIVRGEIKFANDGDAGADLKDAKHEAMAAVLSQLEDEKAQWDALEQEALAGASADDEASMEQMRKDVEEVNKAVEALIAAELAAENGEGGTAEELAKRAGGSEGARKRQKA